MKKDKKKIQIVKYRVLSPKKLVEKRHLMGFLREKFTQKIQHQ